MPRGHTNASISNLSLLIPRSIHRQARIKYLRSGAPSFAAWVAAVLETAQERTSSQLLLRAHMIELDLTHARMRKGITNNPFDDQTMILEQ